MIMTTNNNQVKTTRGRKVSMGIGAFLIAISLIVSTTIAYAQIIPTTAATQIVESAKADCATKIRSDVPELKTIYTEACISLVHNSPTMVVLTGDLLVNTAALAYADNTSFWKAVNDLKNAGYTISSVELAGQGNQGNPHKLYVVMSK
jgi:hypothetical protein